MGICQYFLQNRCKYGVNCVNKHELPDANRSREINFIDDVVGEVIAAERGKQWPLSSFAPFRGCPPLQGLEDTSPEELRSKYYIARNSGQLNEYVALWKNLVAKADGFRSFLKRPSRELSRFLEDSLQSTATTSINSLTAPAVNRQTSGGEGLFGSSFQNSQSTGGSGIFGSSAQATTPFANVNLNTSIHASSSFGAQSTPSYNVFSQATSPKETLSSSIFNTNPTSTPTQNIFGSSQPFTNPASSNQPPGANIFSSAQPSTNVFSNQPGTFYQPGGSIFGANQSPATNLFQATPAQSTNIIQGQSQPQNIFSPVPSATETNIYGKATSNPNNYMGTQPNQNENHFSQLENLTVEEKTAFESPVFKFGKIPLNPPPESMCI